MAYGYTFAYTSRKERSARMPMPLAIPTEKVCPACGGKFLTGGRDLPRRKQVYCSMVCQQLARYRTGTKSNQLSATDAAYIAGLADGEGSIMLNVRDSGSVSLRFLITNTNREVLDWMAEVCGVGTVQNQYAETATRKATYHYQTDSIAAYSIVSQIVPYAKIKAEQMKLAVWFFGRLSDPALKADRKWQYEAQARMRELNRRGPTYDGTFNAGG